MLDLACGSGRHALWLARQGFEVVAADRDEAALSGLRHDRIEPRCVDLEQEHWPFEECHFDGVVVSRYLYRPHLNHLVKVLNPGGVLIYETFMRGNERFGRPARPEFLLAPGELLALAAENAMEVLASFEGYQHSPKPAMMQAICARQPR